MLADFSLKIKSAPDHPTAITLEDSWHNHYGKFKQGREPYGVKVKKILRSANIEDVPIPPRDVEPWGQNTTRHHLQQQKQRICQVILDKWQETYDYGESGNFYNELYMIVDYKLRDQLSPINCHRIAKTYRSQDYALDKYSSKRTCTKSAKLITRTVLFAKKKISITLYSNVLCRKNFNTISEMWVAMQHLWSWRKQWLRLLWRVPYMVASQMWETDCWWLRSP